MRAGEGAFGLLLTAAAHVQNGNGTHVCCDLRNRATGLVATPYGAAADAGHDMATVHAELGMDPCALVLGADQDTGVDEAYGAYDTGADPFDDFPAQSAYPTEPTTELAGGDMAAAEDPFHTQVGYFKVYDASGAATGPVTALQGNGARAVAASNAGFLGSAFCGPALRLTGSEAGQVASAWCGGAPSPRRCSPRLTASPRRASRRYGRPQVVDEGFETRFSFRLSNPSLTCKALDNAYTHCRCGSRCTGGEGERPGRGSPTPPPLRRAALTLPVLATCPPRFGTPAIEPGPAAAAALPSSSRPPDPAPWGGRAAAWATTASPTRWPSSSTPSARAPAMRDAPRAAP